MAKILERSMPHRKPSFYKRHPECRHDPSKPCKRVKVKFTARKEQKLIYYSENRTRPTESHRKSLQTVAIILGLSTMAVLAVVFFGGAVVLLIFPVVAMLVWSSAFCYIAYEYWHKEPNPYRKPKDPIMIDEW